MVLWNFFYLIISLRNILASCTTFLSFCRIIHILTLHRHLKLSLLKVDLTVVPPNSTVFPTIVNDTITCQSFSIPLTPFSWSLISNDIQFQTILPPYDFSCLFPFIHLFFSHLNSDPIHLFPSLASSAYSLYISCAFLQSMHLVAATGSLYHTGHIISWSNLFSLNSHCLLGWNSNPMVGHRRFSMIWSLSTSSIITGHS